MLDCGPDVPPPRPGDTLRLGPYEVTALAAALPTAIRNTPRRVVLVTNEVGSGIVPATAVGLAFRDRLGQLNARVAAECDQVWLVAAGTPLQLR